jgi:mannitol/fructose-specific phosphotransferase system IIA component (Ntr-type)
MRLTEYLKAERVFLDLDSRDVESVLETMASRVASSIPDLDPNRVLEALRAREQLHSTALGQGVAIPHATVEAVPETVLCLGIDPDGVEFGAEDGPVRIFFTLISPPGRESEHIKLLARICRLVKHPGFIDDLIACESAAEALAVVADVDSRHI